MHLLRLLDALFLFTIGKHGQIKVQSEKVQKFDYKHCFWESMWAKGHLISRIANYTNQKNAES